MQTIVHELIVAVRADKKWSVLKGPEKKCSYS